MNWDAIGAVGEVVGALAVLVTLAYLALQMRQNTKAMNLQTAQAVFHQSYEFLSSLAEQDRATTWLKLNRAERFEDNNEWVIAQTLARCLLTIYDNNYYHYLHGSLDGEIHKMYQQRLRQQFSRNKGLREFWESNCQLFTESFQTHVKQTLMEQVGS